MSQTSEPSSLVITLKSLIEIVKTSAQVQLLSPYTEQWDSSFI